MMNIIQDYLQSLPFATSVTLGTLSLVLFLIFFRRFISSRRSLPRVPEVPGIPIFGNLLQLKERKPYKMFTKWAETYGPIFSIRLGANPLIVLSSNDVAKEAMVTRFASISTRKLSYALKILTLDKMMVAMSDYDDFHKTVKRLILTNLLGPNAQKRVRCNRDNMVENLSGEFHACWKKDPLKPVNFKKIFEDELFRLSIKQALGRDVESIYVEELGATLSKKDLHKILVADMMEGSIDVDWRDFFPYLKWVPNKGFETRQQQKHLRRMAVMNALINEEQKRIESGEESEGYLKYLLAESNMLTKEQIIMLVWEAIIASADTTLVTTEWAIYELAKNQDKQDRLYREIQRVCGSERIKEENFSQIPFLSAIVHETLRKHSPVPLIPLRYVHEDIQIGGYHVPAGSQISVNIYGSNMDKNRWENPKEWNPERFLDEKYDPVDLQKTIGFGAGKRTCVGALQAMTIACASIGRLVQEFEWKLRDGEEENVDTLGLTSQKLYPLHAVIKPRK